VNDLWAAKREDVGLIDHAINFEDFLTYMAMIHQRHRQTDRQTDRQTTFDSNTVLCTIVHRAVKMVARCTVFNISTVKTVFGRRSRLDVDNYR